MSYIQGEDKKQMILFPEAIDDYITEDNPVQFIDAFVDSLDLKDLGFKYAETKSTGRSPYDPADMLKLYCYGYLNAIRSSRKLEKECARNVEVMWLLKKLKPDFKTIADFRKDNRNSIKLVFKEMVALCRSLDLYGRNTVAIDGCKFRASNAKKQNFSADKLKDRLRKIDEQINQYLHDLEQNDDREKDTPKFTGAEIKAKLKQLEERKQKYQSYLQQLKESEETQISLTDPDSRNMMSNQRFEVSYNIQATVDEKYKLIVDYEVTNATSDINQLGTMAIRAKEIMDAEAIDALADKGYYNAEEIKACTDNGITPYIPKPAKKPNCPDPRYSADNFRYDREKDVYRCPGQHELIFLRSHTDKGRIMREYGTAYCATCEFKPLCSHSGKGRTIQRWEHEKILEEMEERLRLQSNKYKERQCIIEHVFGTMKRAMNAGYLLTSGLLSVGAEVGLLMLTYNIKRVMKILGVRQLVAKLNG